MTTDRSPPDRHLRHHPARRRAVARRLDEPGRKAPHRRGARGDGRRRDRGRLPDLLARRLRGRARDRQAGQDLDRLRPGARRPRRHRAGGGGDRARPARAHPHLHLHQPAAHEVQAAAGAGPGLRARHRQRHLRAPLHRRRRVVVRGRLAQRPRLPVPLRRSGDRRRRAARSTSRTRSAMPCPTSSPP